MFTRRLLKIKIHSRRVFIFKRSLPIFAFLLMGIMIVWPNLSEQKDKFTARQIPEDIIKGSQVDMSEVRFFSKDAKNRPLVLVASSVQETDPEQKVITLNMPKATYTMENGIVLTSTTSLGLAYQKEEYLFFKDKVDTITDNGWKAISSQVIYDYKKGSLESSSPVNVSGPDGVLDASKGFVILEKGNVITFNGHIDTYVTSQKKTIYLTCEGKMVVNQTQQTINASNDVVVKQDGSVINAETMILYYQDKQQNQERIKEIVAIGNVIADNGTQKITGEKGIYNPATGVIEMTGNVVLIQGQNQAIGTKATLNLRTGISSLTATEKNKPSRIKGQLIPMDLQ
ncbi:MAG: LPS export ABC transporter periplasmic protein LptC [Alphaproteobacteria bacterium]|jgi:lipopolysaccharide export system protein LptA|nr:LPS export ABC transporter periplasmic protein LptC [Alphaproteobacteria bacterium]